MSTAWLVHGFNVSDDGARTIDRLGPFLKKVGWTVGQFDYGWTLVSILWRNPSHARRLAALASPGDVAIGHSNGCAIIHRACHDFDAPFRRVYYVNPALDVTAEPGDDVDEMHVFYSPDDTAVLASKLIPGTLWGSMGRDGYTGDDARVYNHNLHRLLGTTELGHSGALRQVGQFAPHLTRLIGRPQCLRA